jgi:hypothetical protein
MSEHISPGEGVVEATFESLRQSLTMQQEYFKKKDFFRSVIMSKQVYAIADKMVENAEPWYKDTLRRHINDIIQNG